MDMKEVPSISLYYIHIGRVRWSHQTRNAHAQKCVTLAHTGHFPHTSIMLN